MNPTVQTILSRHNGDVLAAQEYCLRIVAEYNEIIRSLADIGQEREEKAMAANG